MRDRGILAFHMRLQIQATYRRAVLSGIAKRSQWHFQTVSVALPNGLSGIAKRSQSRKESAQSAHVKFAAEAGSWSWVLSAGVRTSIGAAVKG